MYSLFKYSTLFLGLIMVCMPVYAQKGQSTIQEDTVMFEIEQYNSKKDRHGEWLFTLPDKSKVRAFSVRGLYLKDVQQFNSPYHI